LISKRVILRERNLSSPTLPPIGAIRENGTPLDARTFEGSLNNKQKATMGMTGCPFIRNTPAAAGNPKVRQQLSQQHICTTFHQMRLSSLLDCLVEGKIKVNSSCGSIFVQLQASSVAL
jgi:hypothetical protein